MHARLDGGVDLGDDLGGRAALAARAARLRAAPSPRAVRLVLRGRDGEDPGQAGHAIATTPNSLPQTIQITYDYFGDEDALVPLGDATVVYGTASYPDDAGLLVHDFPGRDEGQIVFYAFDYAALTSPAVALDLLADAQAAVSSRVLVCA